MATLSELVRGTDTRPSLAALIGQIDAAIDGVADMTPMQVAEFVSVCTDAMSRLGMVARQVPTEQRAHYRASLHARAAERVQARAADQAERVKEQRNRIAAGRAQQSEGGDGGRN